MFEVRDSSRTLQFNGKLLSKSSSWRKGSVRWIEFALYKTENGSYILSRIGVSLMYHGATCEIVRLHNLTDDFTDNLEDDAIPCEECSPNRSLPIVFPEKYRYWAQVSDNPQPVLDSLYKYNENGARYLTYVARKLLDTAAENDESIDSIYRIEIIP
jgi:hypothetical protein